MSDAAVTDDDDDDSAGPASGNDASESAVTGDSDDGSTSDGPVFPPDLGSCGGESECVIAAGSCFEEQGVCVQGSCEFAPKVAGSPCDDADTCTEGDVCNGMGGCVGQGRDCSAPNGAAMCEAGACGALMCDDGFDDCNGDFSDGCETQLDSADNCGACGETCSAGANASATCDGTQCNRSCTAPFENCDGDWANGCEIPTGIPNQCDATGLNAVNGCWTAHCGNSGNADAVNFGDWYCFECTTCHVPSAGQCQWCSHDTGNWFPAASCGCGPSEDLTCG